MRMKYFLKLIYIIAFIICTLSCENNIPNVVTLPLENKQEQLYKITIIKNDNGSVKVSETEAKKGTKITLTVIPEEKYCLDKLSVVDVNTNKVTVTDNSFIMPENNVVISATFIRLYSVTFDSNGGSNITAQYVKSGRKAEQPATPERDGFIFTGWYQFDSIFDFSREIYNDIILTARWETEVYYINLDNTINLSVTPNPVAIGSEVLVTVTADDLIISGFSVKDSHNNNVPTETVIENKKYKFIMPQSDVYVDLEKDYTFHTSIQYLSSDTTGTLERIGLTGNYVYFGDWPTTIKSSEIIIDETDYITRGGFTYYKGNDGYWYAKCIEKKNRVECYHYSDGSEVGNSSKFFKVQPIKWRILTFDYDHDLDITTEGKKLLLVENVVTSNIPFYSSSETRQLGSNIIYPNNYKYSNIRAFLNGIDNQFVLDGGSRSESDVNWSNIGFLQTAFTTEAQGLIEIVQVDNSISQITYFQDEVSDTLPYICNNTFDKVFLLSVNEATNNEYGFYYVHNYRLESLLRGSSDWAKANSVYCSNTGGGSKWILRTPNYFQEDRVWETGWIMGDYKCTEEYYIDGIVPAIVVSN